MLRISSAKHLGEHRLRLHFNDGTSGDVDLADRLSGAIFEPLNDIEYFSHFDLSGPTLEWPNGADFAPEYLRDLISEPVVASNDDGSPGTTPRPFHP